MKFKKVGYKGSKGGFLNESDNPRYYDPNINTALRNVILNSKAREKRKENLKT